MWKSSTKICDSDHRDGENYVANFEQERCRASLFAVHLDASSQGTVCVLDGSLLIVQLVYRFIWFNLEPKGCKEVESYTREKILRNNGFRTRFGLKSNLFDAAFLVNFAHGRAWLRLGGSLAGVHLNALAPRVFFVQKEHGFGQVWPSKLSCQSWSNNMSWICQWQIKKIKDLF